MIPEHVVAYAAGLAHATNPAVPSCALWLHVADFLKKLGMGEWNPITLCLEVDDWCQLRMPFAADLAQRFQELNKTAPE